MIRRALPLTLAAAGAAAVCAAPAVAAPTAGATATATRGAAAGGTVRVADASIPGSDGVILDAVEYLPASGPARALVVMPASWATPKREYGAIARHFAAEGIAAVAYTTRGFWRSTGTIMVAGPEDIADLSQVIGWAQGHVALSPAAKVGTFGISYGAGIGLLGAAADPRISAVVALSGWTDLQTSLLPGGTVAKEAVTLLGTSARLTGRPSQLLLNALADARTGDVSGLLPLAGPRSVGRHVAELNRNGAAIMIGNGWQDSLFPPGQFFDTFDKLTVPKRLELSPGDHATSEAAGAAGLPNAKTADGERWLEHYLLGVPNGADRQAPVRLEPTLGGAWRSFRSAAAVQRATRVGYLGSPSGRIGSWGAPRGSAPNAWSATYAGGTDSGATSGPIMITGLDYQLGRPIRLPMASVNRAHGLVWEGAPLRATTRLGGRAALHAELGSTRSKATIVGYLYDVDRLGVGTLLSWQPLTLDGLTAGRTAPFTLRFQPVLATVPAGHRLAVVVDSVDQRYLSMTAAGDTVRLASTAADPATVSVPMGR